MSPYLRLALFGLKQVVGGVIFETVESVVKFVEERFRDNSQTLPRALAKANDRAWNTLAIALAGDGWFDYVKNWFAACDEKAFADQVRIFLKSGPFRFDGSSATFRKKCLAELNSARQLSLLSSRSLSSQDIARQTASFQRYTDRQGMIEGAEQVVAGIADDLAEYPSLAQLLRQPTPEGPPLLVAAFAFFFRREVETDTELAHGLFWDGLRQLSASQEKGYEEVEKVLTILGQNFDRVFNQLARIEEVVVETLTVHVAMHEAVLDIQAEMQRLASVHLANTEDVRRLMQEVLNRVTQAGMQKGEVKPQYSFSIRSQDEHKVVKQLLARFRHLPPEQQKECPALLNGLGKLQIGSRDFESARQTFLEVSANVTEATAQAEAQFNAYRAALEERRWADALAAIEKAATLDSERFAPFPLQRYQAKKILGAGGFGTAFLCQDRFFNTEVVVKAMHDAALDRNMNEVFREAQVLGQLHHPVIIGVRDCSYADLVRLARPFIVMDYFPGGSLENYIRERGAISPQDLIVVANQIAQGMQAAHQQNILHRDLKPDNVLVCKAGPIWQLKIIDFGLAMPKQTIETSMAARSAGNTVLSDSVAGTIKYAPPEQMGEFKGIKPGPYSDVYAFGKLCCYALFRTTEPNDRHWKQVPENIRTDLKEMLDRCREEELEHRLLTFEPVLKVLQALDPSAPRKKRPDAKEGETKLTQLVRDAFDRAQGKLNHQDRASASEIRKKYKIPRERVRQIVSQIRQERQKTYPSKGDSVPPKSAQDYIASANAHFEKGDFDRAVADANEAIWFNLKDANAYTIRANAYLRKNEYDHAVADATEAIRLNPQDAFPYRIRARAYGMMGNSDQAIADATEAIRLDPKNARAYDTRAKAYHSKKQYDQAIADATEGIRLDPNNAWAYETRAEAYQSKNQYDQAVADATEAIRLDPKNVWPFRTRAEAYRRKKDYDGAVADATEVIRLDPEYAWDYYTRAEAYYGKGDFDKAVADATEAIRLNPQQACFYWTRSDAYWKKGDYDRAIADHTEAIRLEPEEAFAYYKRAGAYWEKGDYDRAVADATEAIRLDSKYASAYIMRAQAYADNKQYDRAVADATEAIRLEPEDGAAYRIRACAYRRTNEYDRAIADATEAIRLDPDDYFAYFTRAGAHLEKEDNHRAVADATAAIRLDLDDAEAYTIRAEAYRRQAEYERAVDDATEAVRLDPEDADAYGIRASAYQLMKEYDLAIADATEAIRLNSKDYDAYCARAEAHLGKEDTDRAIADATEAIRLNPEHICGYNARAHAYRMKDEYDRAIADATEAIRLDPTDGWAYGIRASAHLEKQDIDQAIADATEAIRLDPKNAWVYFVRAKAFRQQGEYDRAVADATEAMRLDPPDDLSASASWTRRDAYRRKADRAIAHATEAIRLNRNDVLAYCMRADAYLMRYQYDRAIADATEAIRLDPKYSNGYGIRAAAYGSKSMFDKAIHDATEAIQLDPKYFFAYSARAYAYWMMDEYDRAIADATEAIRLDPKDAKAYQTRGCAFRRLGDFCSAIRDLTEALRLDPGSGWTKHQLEMARNRRQNTH